MTYPLHGLVPLGGNRLSEGEYHDSLIALQSLENTRALYYALSGTETDGTPAAPAAGHTHDTGSTELSWLQVGSWRTYTLRQSDEPYYGARIVDEVAATPIAFFAFVLPIGSNFVTPRAMIRIPTAVDLDLVFDFYDPAALNGAPEETVTLSETGIYSSNGTNTGDPKWTEGTDVDLSNIALTGGRRIVYLLVSASVSAATADVVQIQLGLTDESSAPASVALDESLALAHADLTADDLATLFVVNPERLRTLIYGVTYPLPRHSRPHNHGEGRGEPLDRHLLSLCYGPHVAEGGGATTGGDLGIPILEPAGGVDYEATPKLLTEQGLFVPGQVDEVTIRLAAFLPGGGTETVDLIVEVRPLADVGYGPGDNLGIIDTLTLTATGGDDFQEGAVTLDLSTLGDIHRDRVFDLAVWQASNPPSTDTYRLCSLLAYAGAAPASLPELATHAPAESIPYSKILEGQEVSTLLGAKIHRTLNQVTYEALGGVPGLEADLATSDTDDPWRRELSETHKHRGNFLDGTTRVDDGAVVRLPLWAQAYTAHVAGDAAGAEDTTGTVNPVRGQLLAPSDDPDFAVFGGRCSVPAGLGAVDVYALLQPATGATLARLWVSVNANPVNGDPAIHLAIRSGPFSGVAETGGSDLVCQALPVDGVLWQPNADRISQGLGVWTLDALRQSADVPSTASTTYPARWTQPIRIEIGPDPGGAPHAYDVELNLFFGIQIGAQTAIDVNNTYDDDARVLALLAVPSPGY